MKNRRTSVIIISLVLSLALLSSMMLASCNKKPKESFTSGYDVELAKEVGKKLNLEVIATLINWDTKEVEVNNGSINMIWNGFTINEDRLKNLSMSQPYLKNKQVFVIQKKDASHFTNIEDFKALKESDIVIEGGSAGQDTAINVLFGGEKRKFAEKTSQIDALLDLSANQAKLSVVDSILANAVINSEGSSFKDKLMVVTGIPELDVAEENFGIGFRKGDEYLKYMVENALYELQQEGKLAKIAKKYGLETLVVTINKPVEPTDVKSKESYKKYQKRGYIILGATPLDPLAKE